MCIYLPGSLFLENCLALFYCRGVDSYIVVVLMAVDTNGNYSDKIIISIKHFLITSNRERGDGI